MFGFALAVTTAAVAFALVAAAVFGRRIAREADALLADARPANPLPISEHDIQHLPQSVQQWLRHSRVIGTRRPTTVRLRQRGDFQMQGRGWTPFEAEQYFTIDPPGFLWKASFRMASFLSVVGRDQYRGGIASMDMRILSLVPVARKTGGGLNQGDLLRFLGEMQWFPAAALADYVTWEADDPTSARASIRHGGVAASMTFTFSPEGRLLEEMAIRYNDALGRDEKWVNSNDADHDFGELRVPVSGEARWEYQEVLYLYIRWRIIALEQDRPVRYRD